MLSVKSFCLSLGLALVAPVAFACGPFLYTNLDLDHFSILDPGIVGDPWLEPFYLYASPPYGVFEASDSDPGLQAVIRPQRLLDEDAHLTNLVYQEDEAIQQANARDWQAYFQTSFRQSLDLAAVTRLVEEGPLPAWLDGPTRTYLQTVQAVSEDQPADYDRAFHNAQDRSLKPFLQNRWAYLAVKTASLSAAPQSGPEAFAALKASFEPQSLSYYRALAYQARQKSELAALKDYLAVFDQSPVLRAQVFRSLTNFTPEQYNALLAQETSPHRQSVIILARFLMEDRDFSPETLQQIVQAQPAGSKAEFILYRMVERIEQEAGPQVLAGLLQGQPVNPKKGIYKALIDVAEQAADQGQVRSPGLWLTLAAYLALYDGDPARLDRLYAKAQALVGQPGSALAGQLHLVGSLIGLIKAGTGALPTGLEADLLQDLQRTRTFNQLGTNRGAFHTLAALIAQHYLATGEWEKAALTYGLIQDKNWYNIYRLSSDDGFWATSYGTNDPVNYLYDVLLQDTHLQRWQAWLQAAPGPAQPLLAWLVGQSRLTGDDLDYLMAFKALRRGDYDRAARLADQLASRQFFQGDQTWRNNRSVFPARGFGLAENLDPINLALADHFQALSFPALAHRLVEVKARVTAADRPGLSGQLTQALWEQAQTLAALQLSGTSLIFASPPAQIAFVNDFELYPYQNRLNDDPSPLADYPFNLAVRRTDLIRAEKAFYDREFSFAHQAVVVAQRLVQLKPDLATELKALVLLTALDLPQADSWRQLVTADRFGRVSYYQRQVASCEAFL